ncbi:MAG: HAMP domain-containing histidine kinase [Acidobacteriota bacterium]|nr:HAMP domain-containing histidine kinase [Acidobacteriota bacterium]
MGQPDAPRFGTDAWTRALATYGAVTQLTVTVYGADEQLLVGPLPSTPLFQLFADHGYAPNLIDCARECLAQEGEWRPVVFGTPASGLATVGTSLQLDGVTVGAAVASYALVDFCQSSVIHALAKETGVAFRELWSIARQQQPIPRRRLVMYGELLQVLGDTLLRESHRARQSEESAARLEQELAAKDEFLVVLSHELRTPLTPILGWARILKTAGDDPAKRLRAAESIERNAGLQLALVSDLFDLNQAVREKMRLNLAPQDLGKIVCGAIETLASTAAGKRIDLKFDLGEGAALVEGDPVRLHQVFANVLSNALKFTPEDGRVLVTLEATPASVSVRVADNGEGIDATFLPQVFDVFRQQEPSGAKRHSGLGIGLTLVKRIVELHGGSVEVASEGRGLGTQVTIELPLYERPASMPAGGHTPA